MDMVDGPSWNTNPSSRPAVSFDPIDDDMENEAQRLRSFHRNNGWRGAVDPRQLAAAGFYYTGIHDHVKCFACDISLKAWLPADDPMQEHWKNQPNCPFISRFAPRFSVMYVPPYVSLPEMSNPSRLGQPIRSVSHDPNVNYRPRPSAVSTQESVRREPASKPNYANEHARLHTFINWPKDCPVQPTELIDAGFYYTGNDDKVECFKCRIVLAGWEPQDTPWGEHEKWSKDCPLVVEHLRRRNPHSPGEGQRPPVFPQEQTYKSPPKPAVGPSETEDELKSQNVVRLPSEQSECSKLTEAAKVNMPEAGKEDEIFYLQKAVHKLIENKQYNYEFINEAIKQRTKIEGGKIESMAELLNAIQTYQEMSNREATSVANPSRVTPIVSDPNASSAKSGVSLAVDPEALHKQVQKMQDAHRCKICLDAEIGIVFLPCGHLVCCPKCAQEIQSKRESLCPICRRHIDSTIRSYLT